MIVSLSTGETVHLRDRFTHKMHKALFEAINEGVVWKQNIDSGDYEKEVPAKNIEFQYEAVLPLLIERIERDGKDVPYSQDWLYDLLQPDYRKLEDAAAKIRIGETTEEEGKKNAKEGR